VRRRTRAFLGAALSLGLVSGVPQVLSAVVPAHARAATAVAPDRRPDIVLVLMDDASYELLRTMREGQAMRRQGADFVHAHVVDSLCCPSRAAIFTGRAPHQTGVLTNTPNSDSDPIGGYRAFTRNGNTGKAFNVALKDSGYTTGFLGKYMNGYEMYTNYQGKHIAPAKVQGWSEFQAVLGGGYPEWGFWTAYLDAKAQMMRLSLDPKPPVTASAAEKDRHYATNVIGDRAVDFIKRHRGDADPYFLEVATYGPHAQMYPAYKGSPAFPSAFADRARKGRPTSGNCGVLRCRDLTLKDLKGYGDPRKDNAPTYLLANGTTRPAPSWRTNRISLRARAALQRYRDRARMVQSIDRQLARIRAAAGPDAYVVLTSDNGFHLGQHQLNGGKGTPYDSDTRVPLVVTGPGVVPGVRDQLVSSLDLASTFEQLAGLTPADYRSGTSFAPQLADPRAAGGRFAFMEHTWAQLQPGEVDADRNSGGTVDVVPSYIAVRSARGLLVRVDLDRRWGQHRYAWELYRYDRPWEDKNVFATDHTKPWARELMDRLLRWDGCEPAECRELTR
jgi:arylsulfatase A-like enzyme